MTTGAAVLTSFLLVAAVGDANHATFSLTVDYRQSLKMMIKAGRYDYINSDITSRHFPVAPGPAEVTIELVRFDRVMSTDAVLAELEKRGVRPATLPELLAFGAKYPEKQREFSVVALASVWRPWRDLRSSPCLWGDARERFLDLRWLDWWGLPYRFAAVRT
ncbi:MAG: hypothetical protein HYR85_18630 [Planctomycetes bacterium]|nr:hypothetical protein [Planctomycetota bacterium]MBI3825638.1 hypothetical protein [Candidatus Rokubacteria bacterium]